MAKVLRGTLSDQIRAELREEILTGSRRPGARLRAGALSEEFGVSVIPVREALHALEAEGLVELEANRGARVRSLSLRTLRETFEVRLVLEEYALRKAIPMVDGALLTRLESLCSRMESKEIGRKRWTEANRDFHLGIYAAGGNESLTVLIRQLWSTVDPYIKLYVAALSDLQSVNAEHRALLAAIRRSDADGAASIQADHLKSTQAKVAEFLQQAEEAGAE